MTGPMRGTRCPSRPPPARSGADVKEVLPDVEVLDAVIVGELPDEVQLGLDSWPGWLRSTRPR